MAKAIVKIEELGPRYRALFENQKVIQYVARIPAMKKVIRMTDKVKFDKQVAKLKADYPNLIIYQFEEEIE